MRTRSFLVGLVVLACVGMGACSDDDDSDGGGTGDRLSAAELATKGNAVCTKLDADVKKLASQFDNTIIFTPPQMLELYKKLLPLVDKAIEDFGDLNPPANLDAKYDDALAQLGQDRKGLADATASEEAAKKLFDTGVDPFTATNEKLAAVGITACSDSSTETGDAGAGADSTVP